jgi:hypothetical protein
MNDTEPRRIRKIIREPIDAGIRELFESPKHYVEEPVKPFPKPPRTRKTLTYALTKPRPQEGYVTLTELASERGIQAQLARLWVARANIAKPDSRWWWKEGGRELKRVRKALGLPT